MKKGLQSCIKNLLQNFILVASTFSRRKTGEFELAFCLKPKNSLDKAEQ